MFSDKFTEFNVYSLFKKEYIGTSSVMPWKYTSIFDNQYKPDLSEETKNRLQLFFYFKYQYTMSPLADDTKYIEIFCKDNVIKEFIAKTPHKLATFQQIREWNNFINTIESPQLDYCLNKMIEIADDSFKTSTMTSVTFDENCVATGLQFCCNPGIVEKNLSSEDAKNICFSALDIPNITFEVHVTSNTNELKLILRPTYYIRSFNFRKITNKFAYNSSNATTTPVKYQKHTENCVNILLEHEVITQEMADYIKLVMPENTKFELECLIDKMGNLKDIILKNMIIEEFGDVNKQQTHQSPVEDKFYGIFD
jgi:hypothetical protein